MVKAFTGLPSRRVAGTDICPRTCSTSGLLTDVAMMAGREVQVKETLNVIESIKMHKITKVENDGPAWMFRTRACRRTGRRTGRD